MDNQEKIETIFSASFDDHGNGECKVEVRSINLLDSIVIVNGDTETTIIEAARDQWGVFYYLKDQTICQEDGTRSFIHALGMALDKIRYGNELTIPCDITKGADRFNLVGFSWKDATLGLQDLGRYETYEEVLEEYPKRFKKDIVDVIHVYQLSLVNNESFLIKKFTINGS